METFVLVTAAAVIILAVAGAMFVVMGRGALNRMVLSVIEKSEEQRSRHKNEIETGVKGMLDGNRQLIDRIVGELRQQLKDSQKEIGDLKGQNVAIQRQLESASRATENLHASTEGLKSLLANNRLRGEWGEQVAEDLLIGAGLVESIHYLKQKTMQEGRPDLTMLLPDGSKFNIDVKFPFDDLVAYQEAKTEPDKKRSLQAFETAVKNKVKQVATRSYIDPEEHTLEFAVMFVPNEMIFSFIYEKLPRINDYANQQGVILAGPFGFTALIRLVLQAYKNFKYETGLREILSLISKFQSEYDKFNDHMIKLGRQIETTQKTFIEVEGTRSRQLTRLVDKISEQTKSEKLGADGQAPLLVDVGGQDKVE